MKKSLIILLGICLCFTIVFATQNSLSMSDTHNVELITDDNSAEVGKEVFNQTVPQVSDGEHIDSSDVNSPEFLIAEIQIPENPFFSTLASDQCLPGDSVQEILTIDNVTPEIIIPNGAVGVFSKDASTGWTCNAGDILSFSFEKYPMETGTSQTLGIGHIKDGVMYEVQAFRDSLDGTYNFTIQEDGVYYIYVIGLSSDPISLKESAIEIL
ncbi:hypothetical protein RFF05_08345 [Bengtsoniella intestinalis]|uniref:hypothetical protein n=1 Tax=Bengtsoniella intestinalis TaxID=3073143 RepID=UPI00391F15B9